MSEIQRALRHPVSWAVGGIVSVLGVSAIVVGHPFATFVAFAEIVWANASMLFTASSIAGFTIAPAISPQVATVAKIVAYVSGAAVIAKTLDYFWDALEKKVNK